MTILVTILVILAVIVVALIVATTMRKRRTTALQQHFGTEYDRTVEATDDRRAAEADLRGREKQRAQLDIRPLPEGTRTRVAHEWTAIQERFVDQPATAVINADSLVCRVMEDRGYPMSDFDSQTQLVSVDHPDVVENFRVAHGIFMRAQTQQASTEDLREALLRYRSLFDELLRPDGTDEPQARNDGQARNDPDDRGRRAPADTPDSQDYEDHSIGGSGR